MKSKSKEPWPTTIDHDYKPTVSVIIPTYNEASIIENKLLNTSKLTYGKDLLEVVVVDSNSTDDTVKIIKDFSAKNKDLNIKLLVEAERKGKSHALNSALSLCNGEIIVISDADCFWPADIFEKALPYLADPSVGAIGGPKILLNARQTWITRMEESYLKSANHLRLGESKAGSTLFFEGGFSAFKKHAIENFDPYRTGSDDCGSIITVIEKNYRAMLAKEATFYSSFPSTFRGKISVKLRRTNQLARVFHKYFDLLINGRVKSSKCTVVPNTLLYLFSPVAFVFFLALTAYLVFLFPYLLIFLLLLAIPRIRFYFYEIVENNILLFVSSISIFFGKEFSVWAQPDDRTWFTKANLALYRLI